jgi:uncharacterized repeat protein (TIGR03837 family)
VDDASALTWMATPAERATIQLIAWQETIQIEIPADWVVESFGCELPESYIAKMARQAALGKASRWVNLEYLSAEPYAEACHLLPSPVMQGVGKGLMKTFFYPGFTHKTGGLLREPDLFERHAKFNKVQWLKEQGIEWQGSKNKRIISLFCYEPAALPALMNELQSSAQPTLLLVTAGRATQAVQALQVKNDSHSISSKALRIHYLPYLTQDDYDHLLWASDFNFVRGEDSLVRAIWAGKPFVWHIYPQDDDAHHAKLEAFLDIYLAHTEDVTATHIRAVHQWWNGMADSNNQPVDHILLGLAEWQAAILVQRDALFLQPELAGNLMTV